MTRLSEEMFTTVTHRHRVKKEKEGFVAPLTRILHRSVTSATSALSTFVFAFCCVSVSLCLCGEFFRASPVN